MGEGRHGDTSPPCLNRTTTRYSAQKGLRTTDCIGWTIIFTWLNIKLCHVYGEVFADRKFFYNHMHAVVVGIHRAQSPPSCLANSHFAEVNLKGHSVDHKLNSRDIIKR